MSISSRHHHHSWLSPRALVFVTLALTFALCATPGTALEAQDPTPPAAAARTDSTGAQLTPAQVDSARRNGEALGAARGGWFGRAFAVGFFTLYSGAAIIIPAAALMEPQLPMDARQRLATTAPEYRAAFEQGYRSKVRSKRVWTSVAGTTLGAAALFGVVALSWN